MAVTNPYYEFTPSFTPGSTAKAADVNVQYQAIQTAFDFLPGATDALTTGTSTFAPETGTGNAYVVTMPDTRLSNQDGDEVAFFATHSNTGAATLNVDGIGAVSMVDRDGLALPAAGMVAGRFYVARYDAANTRFVLDVTVTTTNVDVSTVTGTSIDDPTLGTGTFNATLNFENAIGSALANIGFYDGAIDGEDLIVENRVRSGRILFKVIDGVGTESTPLMLTSFPGAATIPLRDIPAPGLSFGDGDSGFYEAVDDIISVAILNTQRVFFNSNGLNGANAAAFLAADEAATSTNPTLIPNRADDNTGLGWTASDQLSLIAGGVQAMNLTELVGNVQAIVPLQNNAAAPSIAFGDGDSGFYENSDDSISVTIGGVHHFNWFSDSFRGANSGSGFMQNQVASATVVGLGPSSSDTDTGLGATAADQLSLIAGGVQVANLTEAAGVVQMIVPLQNNATTPSIAFGDGDTGFYETSDDVLRVATSGTARWEFNGALFRSQFSTGGGLTNESPSSVSPSLLPRHSDLDTGIGYGDDDAVSIVCGGIEAERLSEVSSAVIKLSQSNVGLTADVGSAQGNGVITSSYNVYSTVGTTGDAATLPSTFLVGTLIHIKNDGANSMDVFPASGDDAGAGTDTAVAVAAGAFAVFIGTAASTTWTKLLGGTA